MQFSVIDATVSPGSVMYIKATDTDEMYENFDATEAGSYVRNS